MNSTTENRRTPEHTTLQSITPNIQQNSQMVKNQQTNNKQAILEALNPKASFSVKEILERNRKNTEFKIAPLETRKGNEEEIETIKENEVKINLELILDSFEKMINSKNLDYDKILEN
jgi:hypothetical protein